LREFLVKLSEFLVFVVVLDEEGHLARVLDAHGHGEHLVGLHVQVLVDQLPLLGRVLNHDLRQHLLLLTLRDLGDAEVVLDSIVYFAALD